MGASGVFYQDTFSSYPCAGVLPTGNYDITGCKIYKNVSINQNMNDRELLTTNDGLLLDYHLVSESCSGSITDNAGASLLDAGDLGDFIRP